MGIYKFAKKHEDAVVQLPTIKYPITKDNLTDEIARKMLKVPALAHLIESTNPAEKKKLEEKFAGTQVDAFGNRILDENIEKVILDPNDPTAAATAGAKEGEVVGVQNSAEDVFVDEREANPATRRTVTEPVEEQQPDPNYPKKQETIQPKDVKPVSNKSTSGTKPK